MTSILVRDLYLSSVPCELMADLVQNIKLPHILETLLVHLPVGLQSISLRRLSIVNKVLNCLMKVQLERPFHFGGIYVKDLSLYNTDGVHCTCLPLA